MLVIVQDKTFFKPNSTDFFLTVITLNIGTDKPDQTV